MRHLVVRPVLDVRVRHAGHGLDAERAVLDRLGALWHERLVPVLDAAFSEAAGPDAHVRIDRLELDLGSVALDRLERALPEALRQALARELPRAPRRPAPLAGPPAGLAAPDGGAATTSAPAPSVPGALAPKTHEPRAAPDGPTSEVEALGAFLATGRLPWWADGPDRFDLDRAVASALAAPGRLAALVDAARPDGLRRLAWQARPETVAAVLRAWTAEASAIEAAAETWRPVARALGLDAARVRAALQDATLSAARPEAAVAASASPTPATPSDAFPDLVHRLHAYAAARLAEIAGRDVADWIEAARDAVETTTATASFRAWLDARTTPDASPLLPERRLSNDASTSEPSPPPPGDVPADARPSAALDAATASVPSADAARQPDDDTAEASLYVRDAGLVLLWPFLPAYLGALGLLDETKKAFASAAARRRGVVLVAHLASGRFDPPEPDLALAKLLCGHPLAAPVEREVEPTDAERDEAEVLLRAVVGHWTALKTTSPDGLREAFLARDGRLDRTDDAWSLTVERRGVDVLVDAVPWAVGVVRLPWMEAALSVTW